MNNQLIVYTDTEGDEVGRVYGNCAVPREGERLMLSDGTRTPPTYKVEQVTWILVKGSGQQTVSIIVKKLFY